MILKVKMKVNIKENIKDIIIEPSFLVKSIKFLLKASNIPVKPITSWSTQEVKA